MQLNEVGILARDGMALVQGHFRLESDEAEAANLTLPSQPGIVFGLGRAPLKRMLCLVDDLRRGPDGLYDASRPALQLAFVASGFPSLETLFAHMKDTARVDFRSDGIGVATVEARHPAASETGSISGRVQSLALTATCEADGLRLLVDGEVGPLSTYKVERPVLNQGRIIADVVVPWACLKVQGSKLVWLEDQVRQRAWGGAGPFPFGPTLAGVALNQFSGSPCFPGRWQVDRARLGNAYPYVNAGVDDEALTLTPLPAPLLGVDGFASMSSGGPMLKLASLGFEAWRRMLERRDSATLEMSGDGIGFLDRYVGRAAEDGSMRQLITRCFFSLDRRPDGLLVAVEGELGDIVPGTAFRSGKASAIGPRFEVQFQIPAAFILARNLPIPRFVQERVRPTSG